jgi:enediyne biosynthesis protein E4
LLKVIAERRLLLFHNQFFMWGRFWFRQFISIVIFAAFVACTQDNDQTLFSKLPASETGVHFSNINLENEDYNVFAYEYFYNGGGVALGDVNNDGLVDIYVSSNQGSNKLYLNKGAFEFEDISTSSGTAAKSGWKTGVAMVDINADGLLDIYVCRSAANESHQRKNSLFVNNGNLTFTDQAREYGLDSDSYSTQASFLDYDRDGDLDMFLLNHAVSRIVRNFDIRTESKTERVPYVGNQLFENRNGKFIDISDSVGVFGPAHNYGLGVCYSDVNSDGWLDLYSSNDYTGSDKLLINQGGKYFHESERELLTHVSRFSMGTDIADINNDGLPDIFSLDMLPDNNKRQKELMWADNYDVYHEMVRNGLHHQFMRNMLHLNNGMGKFSEIGQLSGISNTDWSWSALFADYDNDGLQDLFVSNGYKRDYTNNDFAKYRANQLMAKNSGKKVDSYTSMLEKMPSTKIHNYLFRNINGIQFQDFSQEWGMGDLNLTHGAAYADLDNDGDLDLVLNNMDEKAGIYRNNTSKLNQNNYLKIKLQGSKGNTFGLGAKVIAYKNGNLMMRELCPYRGFQSSVEPALYFGLGIDSVVDSLIVRWPGDKFQKFYNVKVNQTLLIKEMDGSGNEGMPLNLEPYFKEAFNDISFSHKENSFIDFKYQPLLTRMYSSQGPAFTQGDVNGDGLKDYFIGGAKNQAGALFIQKRDGSFINSSTELFLKDAVSEDVDAVFFDIDGDKDQDLYVVSGGYEFDGTDPSLRDRLYVNDGTGKFVKKPLPEFLSSGSCARPADIDQDGDQDLFVGGRIVPGRYPEAPESQILLNDGMGNFSLATDNVGAGLKKIGMVTDASWLDVNNDKILDLVVVGEWMGVSVFVNQNGKLVDQSNIFIKEKTNGFWNCLLTHDFDHDGDLDFIAGNYGLNSQMKPSLEKPASLYYYDFDENGSVDPLLFHYIKDENSPFQTRDELIEQLPAYKKKYIKYADYTTAKLTDILSDEALKKASKLQAFRLETTYFQNDGGTFSIGSLPIQIQFSPLFSMTLMDVNKDGHDDLVTGGNLERTRARTGLLKGNNGFIFLGDGTGRFEFINPAQSGINIPDDVRKIIVDKTNLLFAINDGPVRSFRLTDKSNQVVKDQLAHGK